LINDGANEEKKEKFKEPTKNTKKTGNRLLSVRLIIL